VEHVTDDAILRLEIKTTSPCKALMQNCL